MSVESNVQHAFVHLQNREFVAALTCACIAIDATGKAEFNTSSERRCRQLINANLDIVTSVGLFGVIYAAPGVKLSLSNPTSPGSPIPIEDIIYKTIRCNLLHEADLPPDVELTEDTMYGTRNGRFQLPVTLIYALLLVVVGSPTNAHRTLNGTLIVTLRDALLNINVLWGKGHEIRRLLQIGPPPNDPSVQIA